MPLSCAASSASAICACHRQRLVQRQRAACDALGERLTGHELHDDGRGAARPFDAVDYGDVRVIQRRKGFRFAFETRQTIGIGCHRLLQHFNGHLAVERRVRGSIHFTHAAGAEKGADLVQVRDVCQG